MRQTMKVVVGMCVGLVAVLGLASPAGAYPPGGGGELSFEFPSQVSSGGEIAITGFCDADDTVDFTLGGESLGSADTDENDEFSATFDVPNLDDGTFSLIGTCGDIVVEGDVEVIDDDDPPATETETEEVVTETETETEVEVTETEDATETETETAIPINVGNGGGGTGGGSGEGPLARTGFNAVPVVTLGAAALVLGGAAVYGSKRRKATA